MKEELIKLYTQYILAYGEYMHDVYSCGGVTSLKPSLHGFIQYLEKGLIE